jgi:hypothetical protein
MKCANKECNKQFNAKTHNQKYCSDECCRVATNRRIMEKYYEKKAIRNGSPRICKKCKTKLSRYNQTDVCAGCEKRINQESKLTIWKIISEIS